MPTTHKLPTLAAALAVLAFATAMFYPALFGGRILAPLDITTRMMAPWKETANGTKAHNHNVTDAVMQYLPYRIAAARSLSEDGYIGWNPYAMGGYSLAGNTMALPGSWTMQLHRFLSFKDAWNLGLYAEFLIGGFGMLVFLRSRNLPWAACLLGAVAYMANSQFVIWMYHRWALGSFCWMPWVLWSSAHGLSWRNPTLRQMLLPFFLCLALLGGSLQHMVFVVLACACLVAGALPGLKSAHREWPMVAGWVLALCLALAMAAFTIVPQVLAYCTNFAIGHTRGGIGYQDGLTQPLLQALLIPAQIWPWLLGDPHTIDSTRLIKCEFMDLAYLGTIPMVLAMFGLFHKGMPRPAKWLILAGLLIPLTPLVGPLYHRVQLLFLLGGAWMAAEMLARLPLEPAHPLIRRMPMAVLVLGLALLVGSFIPAKVRSPLEDRIVAKSLVASADSNFGADKAWIEQRARGWARRFSLTNPRTASVYGFLVIGTIGLVLSSRRYPISVRWGHVAILGATGLELFTLFQTWATYSDPGDLLPGHPAIETVRKAAGSNRVLQITPEEKFANVFAMPNLLSSYGIASVDAYESIQYRSAMKVVKLEAPATRLTLAGVGIAVQASDLPAADGTGGWPAEEIGGGYVIRTNPEVPAPIVAGSGAAPVLPNDIDAALKTAVPIHPSLQTMNRWAFDIPPGCDWIRISQNWHEGWQWKIPGRNWQSCRMGADNSCWIEPPPTGARHAEVRFVPRPPWLTCASLGAALAWLCLIPLVIWLLGRRRAAQPTL